MNNDSPRWKRVILEMWIISLVTSLFIGLLQAFLMSDIWWMVLVTIGLPPAAYMGLRAFKRAYLRGGIITTIVMTVVGLAHLILPVRMILSGAPPTVDAVILGLVAGALFLTL